MTTKCVKMCRNGDNFFPPVNVVVNPRDIRSMDAFLDRVTQATRMRNAARKVCTPKKGRRIEDLTKLISGETYVAVGQEAFKNLEYGNIQIRRPVIQHREIKIEPVKHSRILMSARCRKVALWESSGLKTIYVYRNGDDKQPSHKILLDRRTLLNMDKVLELVTDRVKLESGAVFALYTMLGKEVISTSELNSGEKYVAVGHGKRFKRTGYNDNQKISPNNSPRRAKVKYRDKTFEKKYAPSSRTEEKQKQDKILAEEGHSKNVEIKGETLNTQGSVSTIQTRSSTLKATQQLENTNKRTEATRINEGKKDHGGKNTVDEVEKTENTTRTEQLNEKEDVVVTQDKSYESVFNATGAKSEKAKQVEDDKEVKVEKPIDQVAAEEVDEEIMDQNQTQSEEQIDTSQEQVTSSPQDNPNKENTTVEEKG